MTILILKIPALLIILHASQANLKSSSHTQLEDIKSRNSEKLSALLLKDWLDQCNSMAEIQARKSKPLELLDMLLKSFIFWQAETLLKFLSMLFKLPALDKIQLESELEVPWESKLLMFLPSEELTRQFISYLVEPETSHSETRKLLLNALLTRLSTARKVIPKLALLSERKIKLKKLPRVIVDIHKLLSINYFNYKFSTYYIIIH